MSTCWGSNSNVIAYNYSKEPYATFHGIPYRDSDICLHGRFSFSNLFEHNLVTCIEADTEHGYTGPFNAFVRNRVHEEDCLVVGCINEKINYMYFENILDILDLGNEVNPVNHIIAYDVNSILDKYGRHDSEGLWYAHGHVYTSNRDAFTLNDVSYYYSASPDFVNDAGLPFPSIGPKATGYGNPSPYGHTIPASERYLSTNYVNMEKNRVYLPDPLPFPAGATESIYNGPIINKYITLYDEQYRRLINLPYGLSSSTYQFEVYRVDLYFSMCPTFNGIPYVWLNNLGYQLDTYDCKWNRYQEVVSVNSNDAHIQTYFYKLICNEIGQEPLEWQQWVPYNPYSVSFEWNAFGEADPNCMTSSGTITTDEIWCNTHTLTGDVSVSDGVTLTISSNTNVNLNTHSLTCTGTGVIVNNGTVSPNIQRKPSGGTIKGLYPTVTSAISAATDNDWVCLGAGTFSGSVSLPDNVTLRGTGVNSTTLNGNITCSATTGSKIELLRVNGDIDINGGSGNYLHCIKANDIIDIDGGTGHLLEFITTVNDGYLDIYNFSPFIHCLTSTNPSGAGLPNGVLCDNCIVEMGESTIRNKYLGLNVSNSDVELWFNNVFCNNQLDIYASGSSDVDVRQPIVMSYCPPPTVGDVTLYNGCSACGSPVKSTGMYTDEESGPVYDRVGDTPAGTAFNELREIYWQISQEQRKDYENGDASGPQKYANEYNQLISGMKKIVNDYPDSDEARHALKYIAFSQRALGQKNTFNEYANLLLSDKKITPLKFEVKNMLVADNIEQGNYELALAIADELLKMDDDPEQVLPLLYRKGVVYDKYLRNYDMAAKMYQAVIELDPQSATAFAATRRLEKLKDADKSPMNEKLAKAVPAEFAVYANYPNPFNPETHIKFDLPEADHVTVEIFDVQGRLVNTLANNQYEAGQHSVTWRGTTAAGTQAASGMYFYRLRYQDQVKTQKMLLIR